MNRKLLLSCLAVLALGCGGGGGTTRLTALAGELTDGDIRILDNQLSDPYSFEAVSFGATTVRLRTSGFRGILRAHDPNGELIAESVATSESEAIVSFDVRSQNLYSVVVAGASSTDAGSYEILFNPDRLKLDSQIKNR